MQEIDIVQFLSAHGYWMMFIFMYLEGPIATLVAAFMASVGMFSLPVVFVLSLIGDILGDIVLYGVGRKWGMKFVNGPGLYIGVKESLVEKMGRFFVSHGGKTIFLVKSTTGLCFVTFIAAGIVRMPFCKFLWYSFLGGIIWSTTLVILGFFFGYLYEQIAQYITWAGWAIGGLAIVVIVVLTLYKKHKSEEIFGT